MLRKAGYIDCFRLKNPKDPGFTCPASSLAGRIDYIFASPELAERLSASYVVTEGNGFRGDEASDHLPVVAEFGERVEVANEPVHGLTTHRPVDLIDNTYKVATILLENVFGFLKEVTEYILIVLLGLFAFETSELFEQAFLL